jgi:D-tyrosyl-tRNA(Tyr) deacylase
VRALLQRVRRARVSVGGRPAGEIGPGALILLGVRRGDGAAQARWLAEKCAELRCFADAAGNLNRSLREVGGAALVVSQFTLYGDCRKGRRPSFTDAAPGPEAEALYEAFAAHLAGLGIPVATGVFGATMDVELVNEGPVTLLVETP